MGGKWNNRVTFNCDKCGKQTSRIRSHYEKHEKHYCSVECRKTGKETKCSFCGAEIYANQHRAKRSKELFCSKECVKKYFSTNSPRGEESPTWNGGKKKVLCNYCGKEKEVKVATYNHHVENGLNFYCNRKCFGAYASKNLSGENSPTYGISRSDEIKKKMGDARRGEKNWNWKGGIKCKGYTAEWNGELQNKIRQKFSFVCQVCGKNGHVVHHIDYNKKNNSDNNLITMCRKCHASTNFNRFFWESHFKYIMPSIH